MVIILGVPIFRIFTVIINVNLLGVTVDPIKQHLGMKSVYSRKTWTRKKKKNKKKHASANF